MTNTLRMLALDAALLGAVAAVVVTTRVVGAALYRLRLLRAADLG